MQLQFRLCWQQQHKSLLELVSGVGTHWKKSGGKPGWLGHRLLAKMHPSLRSSGHPIWGSLGSENETVSGLRFRDQKWARHIKHCTIHAHFVAQIPRPKTASLFEPGITKTSWRWRATGASASERRHSSWHLFCGVVVCGEVKHNEPHWQQLKFYFAAKPRGPQLHVTSLLPQV